jgi:DNA mismatch repair protein MutL
VGRIQKLSDELANQIAAGEVVERPASVVKELLENGLDAHATRISVDVEQGGTRLIRVTDDGHGMSAEDAVLAFERHATSKIRTLEDLFHLGSFGFRGEALPSIASVSRLSLRTRPAEQSEGCAIEIAGGKLEAPATSLADAVRPAGGAAGTTIEVRDLFFNVPARRKFLKATATESAHVGDVVLGAALARPDVTFTLARDGRVVREYLRVSSRAERARSATAGEQLAHVLGERGPLRIEAMLAAPERARAGTTGLALLVNGRPVRDRVLARAVAHAYGSVLDGGRYPVGVVWLDLPPELVDVNVHPQKAEVRFTDARGVFDGITRELHASLARAYGLPELGGSPFAHARLPVATLAALEQSAASVLGQQGSSRPSDAFANPARRPGSSAPPTLLPEGNLFATAGAAVAEHAAELREPDTSSELFARRGLYASLRYLGQARTTFLVCEGTDGLYVLDQHAAAERVTFDRLRRAHASRAIPMQRLLVPEVVELPSADVAVLEEHADEVAQVGVELRAVGDAAIAVHAVPAMLARVDPGRIVRDLASELARDGGRSFHRAVDLVLATMACHGSIRAGDTIAPEEAEALLTALDLVDFAGHCPHGRPVLTRLPFRELEHRVGR